VFRKLCCVLFDFPLSMDPAKTQFNIHNHVWFDFVIKWSTLKKILNAYLTYNRFFRIGAITDLKVKVEKTTQTTYIHKLYLFLFTYTYILIYLYTTCIYLHIPQSVIININILNEIKYFLVNKKWEKMYTSIPKLFRSSKTHV
jgi:hypothetical protein